MRKLLLAMAVCLCGTVAAENVAVLDISKESVKYDDNGVWNEVYSSYAMIYTDDFFLMHNAPSANYFNGFFPSKVSTIQGLGTMDDQWGCMARGGVSGEGSPFLGAYWDAYNDSPNNYTCAIYCNYAWYAVGFYVCNNPYTYYAMKNGNEFCKKFGQGDWLKLVIHAVNQYQTVKDETIEFYLADYRSENPEEWTMNDSWEWVDLTGLGICSSFFFTMESSDTGEWGMNTPSYFCIDRLTISQDPIDSVDEVEVKATAYYNRAADQLQVETEQAVEVALYAVNGTELVRAAVEGLAAWDMSRYPAGVYVVRCGHRTIKVIK